MYQKLMLISTENASQLGLSAYEMVKDLLKKCLFFFDFPKILNYQKADLSYKYHHMFKFFLCLIWTAQ